MGKGYKHGGSGGVDPLNFTVKTYPSETELKADKPKENTIGVITTTTMTSWVFSATEPSAPEVGMVWFTVETASGAEFNALKKNAIQVYPVSAKQYVGSKWTDVTALSNQGEEWVDWIAYLFKSGVGFNSSVYKKLLSSNSISMNSYTTLSYSLLSGNTAIVLQSYANGNDFCPVAFDVDLSKYKTMYIDATVEKSNGGSAEMALKAANEGDNNITSIAETRFVAKSSGARETFTYPVESITTVKRVVLYAWNGRKATIHNIWFD